MLTALYVTLASLCTVINIDVIDPGGGDWVDVTANQWFPNILLTA